MIPYESGYWSVKFIFRYHGSVFPKALVWAIPAGLNAFLVYWLYYIEWEFEDYQAGSAVAAIWSSFTFVLGFLVVFRTQQAYTRYWEGATLVQQARANFFSAASSVVAFCSREKQKHMGVEEFQHFLVRLMSMLHCIGLQTVADHEEVKFEFFNTDGIELDSLRFLSKHSDKQQRCEIVIQWIQRLVVEASGRGLIDVPAPILTRFFQELSQGSVQIINARNMTNIPFPFPYAQLLTALLVVHWTITPFFCAILMKSGVWSACFSFVSVFAFWGANYIAAEIESPFGEDSNDLPLHALQKDMNKSLWILLHPHTQRVPKFEYDKEKHRKWDVVTQDNFYKKTGEDLPKAVLSWMQTGTQSSMQRKTKSNFELPFKESSTLGSVHSMISDRFDTSVTEEPDEEEAGVVGMFALSENAQLTDIMRVVDCLQKIHSSWDSHIAPIINEVHRGSIDMPVEHATYQDSDPRVPLEFNRVGIELRSPNPTPPVDLMCPCNLECTPQRFPQTDAHHRPKSVTYSEQPEPSTPTKA